MQAMNHCCLGLKEKAVAAAESGDFVTAVQLFTDAISVSPQDATIHEQQAQCLIELGEYVSAREAAQEAIRLEPSVSLVQACWTRIKPTLQCRRFHAL